MQSVNTFFTQAHDFIKRFKQQTPQDGAPECTGKCAEGCAWFRKLPSAQKRPAENKFCKKELQKRHLNQPKTFTLANKSSIMPLANGRAGITGLANQLEEEKK